MPVPPGIVPSALGVAVEDPLAEPVGRLVDVLHGPDAAPTWLVVALGSPDGAHALVPAAGVRWRCASVTVGFVAAQIRTAPRAVLDAALAVRLARHYGLSSAPVARPAVAA